MAARILIQAFTGVSSPSNMIGTKGRYMYKIQQNRTVLTSALPALEGFRSRVSWLVARAESIAAAVGTYWATWI